MLVDEYLIGLRGRGGGDVILYGSMLVVDDWSSRLRLINNKLDVDPGRYFGGGWLRNLLYHGSIMVLRTATNIVYFCLNFFPFYSGVHRYGGELLDDPDLPGVFEINLE